MKIEGKFPEVYLYMKLGTIPNLEYSFPDSSHSVKFCGFGILVFVQSNIT